MVSYLVKDGRNGIHTLVIFHEDWVDNHENEDYINSFLGVTFAGQTGYDNSNARSNHDLMETLRELDKFERDYLLIFARSDIAAGSMPMERRRKSFHSAVVNCPRPFFSVSSTSDLESCIARRLSMANGRPCFSSAMAAS